MRIMILTAGTKALFWFRMDMMKTLVRAGHEVIAVGSEPEEKWASEFAKARVRYRNIAVERTGTNPFSDLRTINSIREIMQQERPDKLFTFHGKGNIYGNIACQLEGFSEIYSSVEGLGNVLAPCSANEKDPFIIRQILKNEYAFAFRQVKKVFFVNKDDLAFFVNKKILDPKKAVLTDGIGVNLTRFSERPLAEKGTPTFLFLGRLIAAKGILDFAKSAHLVKKWYPNVPFQAIVIGSYEQHNPSVRHALQPYIEEGSIQYHGSHHDVRPYLNRCSAVVLPSTYNEGLPKSLMEAMAVGRAIITTDTTGCRETVIEGKNGLLVQPHDIASITAAMIELSTHPEWIRSMGHESRIIAERRFDVHHINAHIFKEMGIPL